MHCTTSPNYTPRKRARAGATRNKLDQALALAEDGYRVFPLRCGDKRPAIKGWPERATQDPESIQSWWECPITGGVQNLNIGIPAGDQYGDGYLVVVDLDLKNGKDGFATLEKLAKDHGGEIPRTRKVLTPTGGQHLYFTTPHPTENTQGDDPRGLGPGIDTRGAGGFVVAPGSEIDGRAYTLEDEAPIAKLPGWLLQKLRKAKPDTTPKGPGIERVDGWALRRAREDIEGEPIPEGGRDSAVNAFVFALHGYGLPDEVRRPLAHMFNTSRCVPPLDSATVEQKCDSVAKTQKQQGRSHPEMEFSDPANPPAQTSGEEPAAVITALEELDGEPFTGAQREAETAAYLQSLQARGFSLGTALELAEWFGDTRCAPPIAWKTVRRAAWAAYGLPEPESDEAEPGAEKPSPARSRLYFETFDTITPDLTKPALVDHWLEPEAMSVVYGDSNSGKTFFALDLALHLARGCEWFGNRVQQGAVVYIAAEGGGSLKKRVAAFRKYYGLDGEHVPFALVPCPVNLLDPKADTRPLIDLVGEAAALLGPVRLVVVDTLARAMAGGNENAPDDMGAFVGNTDQIRYHARAHLMVIHHTGKDRAKGARGHSSLRAATDTEIEIKDGTATGVKQRDMETGRQIGFRLEPVEIGADVYGAPVTSCVVMPRNLSAEREFALSERAAASLRVLREMEQTASGEPVPTGVDVPPGGKPFRAEAWRQACEREGVITGQADTRRKQFQRARKELRENGAIGELGALVWAA